MNKISKVNKCFESFKDKHKNKSAAVIGCGPTLKKYKGDKNLIHVGCNEALYRNLNLDYFFVGDAQAAPEYSHRKNTFFHDPKSYNEFKPNIAKFVRNHPNNYCNIFLCNGNKSVDHAIHYDVCPKNMNNSQFINQRQQKFQTDIVRNYMYSRMTISWEMMQFTLWTGVNKIYLIGHDCSYEKGSVENPHIRLYGGKPRVGLIDKWEDLKKWSKFNYPEVEIKIINPVAMKHFEEASIEDIQEN